ncbi:MAG: hypothetical protein RIS52_1565 [Pseudomonadota bacterium]|jgi:ribosomal protein L25 (general stress protein Ctc)
MFNRAGLCACVMVKFKPCFSAALLAILLAQSASPAWGQQGRRDEQDRVREEQRKGTIQTLRQIEANVVPAMQRRGAQYIGAEFDPATLRYRLKFVRQSSVIWIDVDGRSGAIVAQAGN